MKTSKLTIATMFLASLAWTSVAKADDPCGAPAEILDSCEVIEEPECYQKCEPDAMLVSCMNDGSAACMAECEGAEVLACEASCAGQCEASCADNLIPQKPKDCTVSCGADCMGGCSAACLKSDDKTLCFAACSQQCSAHCTTTCEGGGGGYGPPQLPPKQGKPELPEGGDYGPVEGACQASCEQACAGSCVAEGARDCEISCQAKAAGSCKAQLTEKCHEVCSDGGIMLCDEQYLDIDEVDACFADLEQRNVAVTGPVETLRPKVQVPGERGAACSVEDQAKLGLGGALFMLASFGLGAGLLRRRRR